ncbi:MAG: recombinase family protein [Oscillospiraceae bacterium]
MDKVAIYCRLSEEDSNKSNQLQESESIQNQKSLLLSYALKNNWDLYKVYCDEDYSGVDSNRPDFNQLIYDASQRKFDIILCKTQSRFTRDMEMVEKFIHHKFLEWGIRFVTAVDNVDTSVKGSKKTRQINGLINEWYLEDLSENVRAVFNDKRRNGKFIGSYAPYGYKKSEDDHNKLVIDEDACDIVKKIFTMRLAGYGMISIAKWLNENKVLNPTDYRISKKYAVKTISNSPTQHLWKDYTVRQILQRETYIGNMIQGKNVKISYKSDTVKKVPKKDWIIVCNTQEPIIESDMFFEVQKLMKSYIHPTCTGQAHALAGKVKCMSCGATMQRTKAKGNYYLRCKANMRYGTICDNMSVRYEDVIEEILKQLRIIIHGKINKDTLNAMIIENDSMDNAIISLQKQAKKLEADVQKISDTIFNLYSDKVAGIISELQFIEMNNHFTCIKSDIKNRLYTISCQLKIKLASINHKNNKVKMIGKYSDIKTLNKACVDELIDYIEIEAEGKKHSQNKDMKLNIYWNI